MRTQQEGVSLWTRKWALAAHTQIYCHLDHGLQMPELWEIHFRCSSYSLWYFCCKSHKGPTKSTQLWQERFWRNVSQLFTLTGASPFSITHIWGSLPQEASGKYIIQIQKLSNKYLSRGSLKNWELSSVVLYPMWCLFLQFKSCLMMERLIN